VTLTGLALPNATLRSLRAASSSVVDRIVRQIFDNDAAYQQSEISSEGLREIVADNISALLAELGGGRGSLAPARSAGRAKAESGIPMASLLHAYRLAGIEVLRAISVEATAAGETAVVLDTVETLWDVVDRYSSAAADEYRSVIEARERRHDESRRAALAAILEGGGGSTEATILGLPVNGWFVVIVAHLDSPAGAVELVTQESLRPLSASAVWASTANSLIGLISAIRQDDFDVIFESASSRRGVGASRVFEHLHDASRALDEARLALQVLRGNERLRRFDDHPLDILLAGSPEAARRLRDAVLGQVVALRPADVETLLTTFETWVDEGASAAAAGVVLHCHRNSVRYRLHRLETLTGRRLRVPEHASELLTAVRAHRLIEPSRPSWPNTNEGTKA